MNVVPPRPPSTVLAFDAGGYAVRAEETFARRAYMEGGWQAYLAGAHRSVLTDAAFSAMPAIDTSHNIFRDTIMRLATRYESPAMIKEGEIGELDSSVLFADHPTIEQYALAYNVAVVLMRVVEGELVLDVLPPDHADIVRDNSGAISKVRVARPTNVVGGAADYLVDEWDVTAKVHSTYTAQGWQKQPTYPWVYTDGRAFAPVVFFRASKPPDWWGACRWPELIEATLEEGIAWTIHRYGRLNSSAGIPYTMDAEVMGRNGDGADKNTNQVNAGPSFVLQLQSVQNKQGAAGVMQPAFDPEKDVQAIVAAYNARMSSLGIGDNALQRGGAESGLAIMVRREGLLRLRNMTEPMFRAADQEFARKAAACARIFNQGPAESPKYRVEYAPIPMGSSENKEQRDQEKHDLDIKVATPASILAARQGIALEEAQRQIAVMRALAEPVAGPVAPVAKVAVEPAPPTPEPAPPAD